MRACGVLGAGTPNHSLRVARMQLVVCCSVRTWIGVDLTLGGNIDFDLDGGWL